MRDSPVKIDCTTSFTNQNSSNACSRSDLSPAKSHKSSKLKEPSEDLTFKLTSISAFKPTPQKGRNGPRQISLSSKQIREASRQDLQAAKRNTALDAIIRNKHRKT